MLLVDSNIFIYARGEHDHSPACRAFVAEAAEHPEWLVSFLVVLEITHYYGDGGEYARRIADAFPAVETQLRDFWWGVEHAEDPSEVNDCTLLHTAHRCGCDGVVSYDAFFGRQSHVPELGRVEPEDVVES